jgi:hypothetical protein
MLQMTGKKTGELGRAGRALEELVAHLERVLGADQNAKIESPVMLPDKVTGDAREFDVVVTIRSSHHELRTAIECRDWERPLDVSHIEAYNTKCSHCDIHSKVIVSPNGYSVAAKKKGDFLGIRCLTLHDIKSIPWIKAPGIELRWRKLLRANWQIDAVDLARELAGVQKTGLSLCCSDGKPFKQDYLDILLSDAINSRARAAIDTGVEWSEHYDFPTHDVRLRHNRTGRRYDCVVSADVVLRMESRREAFKMFEYYEPDTQHIARGAIADISAPGTQNHAKAMLIEKADGSRSLVLINGNVESGTLEVEEEDTPDG